MPAPPAKAPPAGPGWIHQIKHDGYRILAERDAKGVTLHTRRGYDFVDLLPSCRGGDRQAAGQSCVIDGEAIAATPTGWRCSTCCGGAGTART